MVNRVSDYKSLVVRYTRKIDDQVEEDLKDGEVTDRVPNGMRNQT